MEFCRDLRGKNGVTKIKKKHIDKTISIYYFCDFLIGLFWLVRFTTSLDLFLRQFSIDFRVKALQLSRFALRVASKRPNPMNLLIKKQDIRKTNYFFFP